MNEWVRDVVHHLRSLYTYQKNKIMGFGLYKTQIWVPQKMKDFAHWWCEECVLLRVGEPMVGIMCEVDEVDEKVSQMGLCWWRYGGPNVRHNSALLIFLYNLFIQERGSISYGKTWPYAWSLNGHEVFPELKWYGHGVTFAVIYGLLWVKSAMEGRLYQPMRMFIMCRVGWW